MKDAVIVSAVRTAVGKAPKGTLRNTRPDELGAAVIKEALARVPGLEASEIEDVVMGCAMPEAEQGMNVARAAAIRAGLPVETSAMTINRFCSSGLQSIAIAADRIRTGSAEAAIAGGLLHASVEGVVHHRLAEQADDLAALDIQRDVVDDLAVRQQAEVLEDHREAMPAQLAEPRLVGLADVLSVEEDLAGGRFDEARQAANQRRLATAGQAHDDEDLTRLDVKRDVVHDRLDPSAPVTLGEPRHLDDCRHHAPRFR